MHALVQLLMVASLTADGNVWGSSSAVVVLALYIVQVCFNAVSHHVTASWGNPIAQNPAGLLVFALLSAGVLYLHVCKYIRVWAEALSIKGLSSPREIRSNQAPLSVAYNRLITSSLQLLHKHIECSSNVLPAGKCCYLYVQNVCLASTTSWLMHGVHRVQTTRG